MSRIEDIQSAVLAALMHVKPDYRSPKQLDQAAGTIARFVDDRLKTPRVAIQIDHNGDQSYFSDGGDVDLLIVDERCPRDRVYLHGSHAAAEGVIDTLIGSDRIGRLGDMPGTEAAIRAMMNGDAPPKPSLSLVTDDQ